MIQKALQCEEAERGAIGSLLLKPVLVPETLDILIHDDFTLSRYRRFFQAIKQTFTTGNEVDMVSLLNALRESGKLKADDAEHIASLTSWAFIPSLSHCHTVKRLSSTRSFLQDLDQAKNAILAGQNIATVIEDFSPAILRTVQKGSKATLLADTITEDLQNIFQRTDNGGGLPGLPTGYTNIDNLIGGLVATNLIILAARPSMGKTTLALNIAENVARSGAPVCFFSMEMARGELTEKLFSRASSVSLTRIRSGHISSKERERIKHAANELRTVPLFLYDQPGLSIHQITATTKSLHMRHGLGLVIVDYLGLMRGEGNTREQEVASLSRGLKCLAMDLKIPVIALSQLNRGVESRTDKRPTLADLRDSGAIEQDANIVTFIYRDEVYNTGQNNPRKGEAEFIVSKNRSGPTGNVKLGTNRFSYSEFTPSS
ncbi:replicative DNA helicase [Desulfosediminicola ganghwensis]|uniref:replicative DNA helicase n=1 Tax=Desulfosediminicola ganghwensis TaxID=2569540 RepID=UPI0010ABCCEE|nr:replicative DNA helicase [Desulfosediminicola ganghwensis]